MRARGIVASADPAEAVRGSIHDFHRGEIGVPLKTLADVTHPFPAFSRMLGQRLSELGIKPERQPAGRSE